MHRFHLLVIDGPLQIMQERVDIVTQIAGGDLPDCPVHRACQQVFIDRFHQVVNSAVLECLHWRTDDALLRK